MKSPETGSAVIRKFIYINELLLPVSCLTSPDTSRLRYLSDPVNALERGGSRGRNDRESACSDRPCMRRAGSGITASGGLARPAVRPTDPTGFVFVLQVPVRDLRSTFADGKEPEPVAPRAGSNRSCRRNRGGMERKGSLRVLRLQGLRSSAGKYELPPPMTSTIPRPPRICSRRRTVRDARHGPRTRSTCPGGLLYVPAFFQGDARGWRASSTSRRSAAR